VIQRMLDQRAGMGLMIGAVPAEQNAPWPPRGRGHGGARGGVL